MRVFVIESPNPIDLLCDRAEHQCIEKIGKLMGHQVVTILVKSEEEFKTAISYISTINEEHDDTGKNEITLCIHISAHGNNQGLQFGMDFVDWIDIVEDMKPLLEKTFNYSGKKILVLSACGANNQKITNEIEKKNIKRDITPLDYVFAIDQDEVQWNDAVLAWTILYHQFAEKDLTKVWVMDVLKRTKHSNFATIRYQRWEEKDNKYKRFIPGKPVLKK